MKNGVNNGQISIGKRYVANIRGTTLRCQYDRMGVTIGSPISCQDQWALVGQITYSDR